MHWYQMKLLGRAQTHSSDSQVCRPDTVADVSKYMEQVGKSGIIARGSGSAYADQALNSGGAVMMSDRLDRIRSFDEKTGELVCEPGLTLETITHLFAPRGFMFPIATGSGRRTLGGAIASNLFGMNCRKKAALSQTIKWMDIVLADGSTVRADKQNNADLFSAVIGGQGLIGFISLISITLSKRPDRNVHVVRRRCANLDALLDALRDARKSADFCVAWVDTSARGAAVGRSVLKTASFTADPVSGSLVSMPKIKRGLPRFMLNLAAMPLIKDIRYRLSSGNSDRIIPYEDFIYPSDHFGVVSPKNVYQLRFSFSEAEGPQAIRQILTELSEMRIHACRAVVQPTADETVADLAFPMRGYCLSLDFIRRKGLEEFLRHLMMIACEHKGRVALCNDALMEMRFLFRMYKGLEAFTAARKKYDPQEKFDSDFARRVLKEDDNDE